MQVGSIVEYVKEFPPLMVMDMFMSGWDVRTFPETGKQYKIRRIELCKHCKHQHIVVEEIIIGYTNTGKEISTYDFQWREVTTPPPIQTEWVDKLIEKLPKVKENKPAMV